MERVISRLKEELNLKTFIDDLEVKGYVPSNVEERVGYCKGQAEEYLADMLEELAQTDPKVLERIMIRIQELMGEADTLDDLRMEVQRLREEVKKERKLRKEYAEKVKEFESKIRELSQKVSTAKEEMDRAREWKPKPAERPTPPEKPKEVLAYEKALHLNVVAWRREIPPGFRLPVWILTVVDEGTGETVDIVMGSPYTHHDKYQLIHITDKRGFTQTVLAIKEKAEAVAPPIPSEEEVEEVVKVVKEKVPKEALRDTVNWTMARGIVQKIMTWLNNMERHVENRATLAVFTYLKSINSWAEELRSHLTSTSPLLKSHAERETARRKVLSDEEYMKLWQEFSALLEKEKINPEEYKERFDPLISWNMPFDDNRFIVLDEARRIIGELKLAKYIKPLAPPDKGKFNWKYVRWGLSAMKFDAQLLMDAAKAEDAVGAYGAAGKLLETADKLKAVLKTSPEVSAFERP